MGDVPQHATREYDGDADALTVADASGGDDEPAPLPKQIARYVVLEEVGQGGMGRVLRGYDPELEREVALKEVRRDALDTATTRRLVAEARAMARLSHPNVVAVFDVEQLDGGDVVLVMEYVAGATLQRWLAEAERDWRTVLARFIAAGRGLVAAHQAGLLHRDFKPANVLVGEHGLVKVTDFGLAKAVASSTSARELLDPETHAADETRTGALTREGSVVGTPRYMAPEQHAGGELGAAADQYAFCVALWEALSGAPPFVGPELAIDKLRGPPAWRNDAVPEAVVDAIRRGLAPVPTDRWPSMDALLDVLARARSLRPRTSLLTVAGVGVLALAVLAWASSGPDDAAPCSSAHEQLAGVWDDARRNAVQAAMLDVGKTFAADVSDWALRELDDYGSAWVTMHREICEATTVRGEQPPAVMDLRMACLHRAKVDLQAATDVLVAADAEVVANAHRIVGALTGLESCADVDALQSGVEPPRPEDATIVDEVRSLLARARAEQQADRYADAHAMVVRARERLGDVAYEPVRMELAFREGSALEDLRRYVEAEAALTQALELASRLGDLRRMQSTATLLLYVVGYRLARMDEALERYETLALSLASDDLAHAAALNAIAVVLRAMGRDQESEARHRTALALKESVLGPEDIDVAVSRHNLGNVLFARGEYAEAQAEHRRALAIYERQLGAAHPEVADTRSSLGGVLYSMGKYVEAEAELRQAVDIEEQAHGSEHPDLSGTRNNLAIVLFELQRYQESEAQYRRIVAVGERRYGADDLDVAVSRSNLALTLDAQGKYVEAETEVRRSLEVKERHLGSEHTSVAQSRANLGKIMSAQGRKQEAEVQYRDSVAILERLLGGDHPDVALGRHLLAQLLFDTGRTGEALALAELAWSQRRGDDVAAVHRGETAFLLARILWDRAEDRTRARELAEQALEAFERGPEPRVSDAAEVREWLEGRRVE